MISQRTDKDVSLTVIEKMRTQKQKPGKENDMTLNFEADVHMHTIMSGHAYGTIREMAQAAAEKGLKTIGITEHGPGIPGTCDPFYFPNVGVVPDTLYGVRVLHGCEANVLNNGALSLADRYAQELDYLIAGIHSPCYENQGVKGNTDNLIACMKHPKVRFVSHPDDDNMPLNYERLVPAARENQVALEVNNSSLANGYRKNCQANYRKMLGLCEQYRVPVVVNSDAHDPSWVGRTDDAKRLLEELQFDPSLILSLDAERLERFLLSGLYPEDL